MKNEDGQVRGSAAKNVLVIHAHPDDIEMLAGGTMARLAERGHKLTFVTMTAGDCGSRDHGPEEIAAIRRAEAADAASVVGARYDCAEFKDMSIYIDDASRRRVTEMIRRYRPDLVITASPNDYHCDHEATGILVRDACFAAGAPNYKTGDAEIITWIPHLYFADAVEGVDREGNPILADFVFNVDKYMDVKREMLSRHVSQREWLRKHHGIENFLEEMEKWTAIAGSRVGIAYGEGFRRYKVHPFPQTQLLAELLGEVVAVTSRTPAAV